MRDKECEDPLKREKTVTENLRYMFSLTVKCPECGAVLGENCISHGRLGHPQRYEAAVASVRKLQGSQYGEEV